MGQVKSIFASKTFWVNVITGVLSILSLPQVATLPPSVLAVVSILAPILNVILRRLTNTPVTFSMPTTKDVAKVALIVLMLVPAFACRSSAPSGLSPAGVTAYQHTQVIHTLDLLRDAAVNANAVQPPLLSDASTRLVVEYHKTTLNMINASQNGWPAIASQSLTELAGKLPPREKELLDPYLLLAASVIRGVF